MTEPDLLAHFEQQLPRVGGEVGGQCGIGHLIGGRVHRFSIADGNAGP
jgi:hypothetical protein